jgi:hypothetical protein
MNSHKIFLLFSILLFPIFLIASNQKAIIDLESNPNPIVYDPDRNVYYIWTPDGWVEDALDSEIDAPFHDHSQCLEPLGNGPGEPDPKNQVIEMTK